MSESVDSQALDKLRQVLTLTFQQNLAVLKQYFPNLYARFKDYTPTNFGLEMDPRGRLNIAGRGEFLYTEDPQLLSNTQFDFYFKTPLRNIYRLHLIKDTAASDLFKHVGLLRNMVADGAELLEESADSPYEDPEYYPFMCCLGVGMGYHIEKMTTKDIGHLYIYEPNNDVFYASLHVADYKTLIETYTQPNKGITFQVGTAPEAYFEDILKLLNDIGLYRTGVLPVYRHYNSETLDDAFSRLFDNTSTLYSGFGFFEDEIISVSHTIKNLKDPNRRVINGDCYIGKNTKKPVFICANGPSLDDAIPFLQKNRDKYHLFSCGSTLMPLYKAGLKPDIHFELERTEGLFDWVSVIEDKSYYKDISIVSMNTVSPKVLDLFGQSYIYMKPNDGGTELLRMSLGKRFEEVLHLFGSNPTVSNAATAFAASTGFNDIYYFGVDLGFKDSEYHHSKDSVYFDKFKGKYTPKQTGDKTVPGNFCESVFTTNHFDFGRHTIEFVLRRTKKVREFNCFNCSDGARIEGAEPIKIEDIRFADTENEKPLQEMLYENSRTDVIDPKTLESNVQAYSKLMFESMDKIADKRLLSVDIAPKQLMDIFSYQYSLVYELATRTNLFVGRMLVGSTNYLQVPATGYLYLIHTDENRRKFVKKTLESMIAYFDEMKKQFTEKILDKLD